jgi:hypothetical protein
MALSREAQRRHKKAAGAVSARPPRGPIYAQWLQSDLDSSEDRQAAEVDAIRGARACGERKPKTDCLSGMSSHRGTGSLRRIEIWGILGAIPRRPGTGSHKSLEGRWRWHAVGWSPGYPCPVKDTARRQTLLSGTDRAHAVRTASPSELSEPTTVGSRSFALLRRRASTGPPIRP